MPHESVQRSLVPAKLLVDPYVRELNEILPILLLHRLHNLLGVLHALEPLHRCS